MSCRFFQILHLFAKLFPWAKCVNFVDFNQHWSEKHNMAQIFTNKTWHKFLPSECKGLKECNHVSNFTWSFWLAQIHMKSYNSSWEVNDAAFRHNWSTCNNMNLDVVLYCSKEIIKNNNNVIWLSKPLISMHNKICIYMTIWFKKMVHTFEHFQLHVLKSTAKVCNYQLHSYKKISIHILHKINKNTYTILYKIYLLMFLTLLKKSEIKYCKYFIFKIIIKYNIII